MFSTARALIDAGTATSISSILKTLDRFGDPALRFAYERGIRILPLAAGERYEIHRPHSAASAQPSMIGPPLPPVSSLSKSARSILNHAAR